MGDFIGDVGGWYSMRDQIRRNGGLEYLFQILLLSLNESPRASDTSLQYRALVFDWSHTPLLIGPLFLDHALGYGYGITTPLNTNN